MLADHRLCQKTGFEIGWDCARVLGYAWEDSHRLIRLGFDAGVAHFGRRHYDSTVYEKKWLQMRLRAWRRGIRIEPDLTASYLAKIDTAICPITRAPFTRGKQLDTDWSIDRVNNRIGYTCRNIVLMSVIANEEKGALSARQIVHLLTHHRSEALEQSALSLAAWKRLALLSAIATVEQNLNVPMLLVPPRGMWMQNRDYARMVAAFALVNRLAGAALPNADIRRSTPKASKFDRAWVALAEAYFHAIARVGRARTGRVPKSYDKSTVEDACAEVLVQNAYAKLLQSGWAEVPDALMRVRAHSGRSGLLLYSVEDSFLN